MITSLYENYNGKRRFVTVASDNLYRTQSRVRYYSATKPTVRMKRRLMKMSKVVQHDLPPTGLFILNVKGFKESINNYRY